MKAYNVFQLTFLVKVIVIKWNRVIEMTKVLKDLQVEEVCDLILKDEVVAFPTETVYGLGIRYNSPIATKRLIEAKNRDESKFFTLMVAKEEDIEKYAYISEDAKKIIDAFMPGDITIIFKAKEGMTNGETIGIRIPDHAYTLNLLEKIGPMYVTSANLSGCPSANTSDEVLAQLNGRIAAVVEGVSGKKQASAVVSMVDGVKILRDGRITREMIEEKLGE